MSSDITAETEARRPGDAESASGPRTSKANTGTAPRVLVIGLGNPLLGDDGVGWRVAEEIAERAPHLTAQSAADDASGSHSQRVEVDCHAGGGLTLMERMVGYDRAIVIDAINLGRAPTGSVSCFPLEELPDAFAGHLASSHETNLQTAMQMGHAIGTHLPRQVMIVAIESPHVYDFSETLTAPVTRAIPLAVRQVLDLLND